MSATAEADEVDDNVLVEGFAVVDRQLGHPDARLGVVAVDVEDRGTDHLRDVGAVLARSGMLGSRGEPNLVVDHDVYGAAGAVTGQHREVEGLGHNTLAGERGVAVQHERHDRELTLFG